MTKVLWYYLTAMWSEMFPSYHVRAQRRMAQARIERLRRFGTLRDRR